MRLQVISDESR